VVLGAAARIRGAYVQSGQVTEDDADRWIVRSIRDEITIARTVDASIESHDAPVAARPIANRQSTAGAPTRRVDQKSGTTNSKAGSPEQNDDIENLVEDALMDPNTQERQAQHEHDKVRGKPRVTDSSHATK
jgi:hypothetical protein